MTYDVSNSGKIVLSAFWLANIMLNFGASGLCTDSGSQICKHGGRLVYGFLHKIHQKVFKKLLKCSSEVWKVKISFISKIFCYLFRTFVHDLWIDGLSINTYLVNFMISVLI